MKATIRRFHSPDVDDLASWRPEDPACFGLLLQVLLGPEGQEGEESFDFVVCTPAWLRERHGANGVIPTRHHILVFEYDFPRLRKAIESIVDSTEGEDWREVAERIGRHGKWEFEDYQEYT